jgi:methyltransferase (TIGR00027 family)
MTVADTSTPIKNVSDTAYWVAYYRAMETERKDAHFRDPYAKPLAGALGESIVRTMPRGRSYAWPMIVRTAVMDEIVERSVREQGTDVILNLACGLDARPYRLDLPASLQWIEVDLPAMIDAKQSVLASAQPKCRLESVRMDLADRAARQALFARVATMGKRVFVISEGLLIYLAPEDVAALADDLHAPATFAEWMFDLASPALLKMMMKNIGKAVAAGGAPFLFAPAESVAFFAPHGWTELEFRNTFDEAKRLKRAPPGTWLFAILGRFAPPKRKAEFARFSGIVRVGRSV